MAIHYKGMAEGGHNMVELKTPSGKRVMCTRCLRSWTKGTVRGCPGVVAFGGFGELSDADAEVFKNKAQWQREGRSVPRAANPTAAVWLWRDEVYLGLYHTSQTKLKRADNLSKSAKFERLCRLDACRKFGNFKYTKTGKWLADLDTADLLKHHELVKKIAGWSRVNLSKLLGDARANSIEHADLSVDLDNMQERRRSRL